MENAVACRENYGVLNFEEYAMSVDSVVRQVNLVQEIMKSIMKDGEHYGVIPGTNKPSLYKPGAEKLGFTFRLAPEYEVTTLDWPGGHREYQVKCRLRHIPTGTMVGEGVGTCTTLEGKYRYRGGEKEGTGQPVPKEYWNLKNAGKMSEAIELIGGPGYGVGKIDGKWEICSIGEKQEHDNPADYYNTCEKMAKKRAHVDAILTATAASDIFTQDVEDMSEVIPGAAEAAKKESKPPVNPPQKKQTEPQKEIQNPDDPCTDNQIKAIHSLLAALKITDDLEKHSAVSGLLQKSEIITSFSVLTKGEASAVIKRLGEDADAKRQGEGK